MLQSISLIICWARQCFSRKVVHNVASRANQPERKVEQLVISRKGDRISFGATGLVYLLPSGDVTKTPWPGNRNSKCCDDMRKEFEIYQRLGCHPRLVKIRSWNSQDCTLTMEYMHNGCLKDYLDKHNKDISVAQRLQWVQEAAEGLQLLHSADVIHSDVGPKNFLLDGNLGLKIADFSGSSFEKWQASACGGRRFVPPELDLSSQPTVQQDIFGLGSTIYTIMTGIYPFEELPSDQVEELYKASQFPDVTGILCGEVIRHCWVQKIASSQDIFYYIQKLKATLDSPAVDASLTSTNDSTPIAATPIQISAL